MPSYTVRSVIRWKSCLDQKRKHVYEERITAWNAHSLDKAIQLAETEAKEYALALESDALDLFQAYWLFDEVGLIPQGTEVFSLLRESDLEPDSYLDAFFDTGTEHQGVYAPNLTEEGSEAEKDETGQIPPAALS